MVTWFLLAGSASPNSWKLWISHSMGTTLIEKLNYKKGLRQPHDDVLDRCSASPFWFRFHSLSSAIPLRCNTHCWQASALSRCRNQCSAEACFEPSGTWIYVESVPVDGGNLHGVLRYTLSRLIFNVMIYSQTYKIRPLQNLREDVATNDLH